MRISFPGSMLRIDCRMKAATGAHKTQVVNATSIENLSKTQVVNAKSIENLRALCKQDRLKEALHIFQITENPVHQSTYIFLLQDCIKNKALTEGKLIHAHINIYENARCFMANTVLSNTLMNMYVKCGDIVDARKVFSQMPQRNVCSWTVMIAAYSSHGFAEEALLLFGQMQRNHFKPNEFTFASVLPACAELASLQLSMEMHREIICSGFQSDVVVANALVDTYAKCGSLETARKVFDKISEPDVISWTAMIAGYSKAGKLNESQRLFQKIPYSDIFAWTAMITGYAQNGLLDVALKLFNEMPERNLVSWNAMIAGFAQNGKGEEALKLFRQMQSTDVRADLKTFSSILPVCAGMAALQQGMEIHENVIKFGYQSEIIVVNAVIDMYAKCGRLQKALELFNQMHQPDVVSWTALIAGYAQNGQGEEALRLFHEMQLAGVKPDSKTFSSILSVCANLAALEQGIEIHEQLIRDGVQSNITVINALIDMYAKCGSMLKAYELFDKMHQRNVVSWTTMIAGYALHGCGNEALNLFEQMKLSRTRPDHVTLLCVLSACTHAGLVDEGCQYFNCMKVHYNITPAMEHYSCVVDLLGRAGYLDKAQDFINKMPIKADASIWICLLGACRTHTNLVLGECVAKHIFELDHKNPAPYVLLSNMYAAAGRWRDIEKVRTMMKSKGIKKTPGCSWIEVNKQVHTFLVGEASHSQMKETNTMFETLACDRKVTGYVLNDIYTE